MDHATPHSISLYGRDGRRKYLTSAERTRVIRTSRAWRRGEVGSLCLMLVYAGCRISEALALRAADIQIEEGFVAVRSLKKRDRILVREIPIPDAILKHIWELHRLEGKAPDHRLWPWCRGRAWWLIKEVLTASGVEAGPHATPKGLRHGFGIHALRSGVPLNLVSRWLGHASLTTTAIYADALGIEERNLAARMWSDDPL